MRIDAFVLLSTIVLASPAMSAQTIRQKVRAWYVWNKHCHDLSKDSAMRDKSCEFRDDVGKELDKAGWCNGHLEKLTFSECAIWMRERHAGFVVRDRNESAWVLRSRRALSRSRCQEGPAGCPERGRALGGLPCAVERGLAQAGRGAEDRGRTQALGRDRHLQDAGSAGALQSL